MATHAPIGDFNHGVTSINVNSAGSGYLNMRMPLTKEQALRIVAALTADPDDMNDDATAIAHDVLTEYPCDMTVGEARKLARADFVMRVANAK